MTFYFAGKKINRVACGSAHSLAWSTSKPVNAGRLPTEVPMEYNHLKGIDVPILRNRLVLLHHFSDLFCPSIPMFDLEQADQDLVADGTSSGSDALRGVLVSSAKVRDTCRGKGCINAKTKLYIQKYFLNFKIIMSPSSYYLHT